MYTRILPSLALSAVITFSLFYVMQTLVAEKELVIWDPGPTVNFRDMYGIPDQQIIVERGIDLPDRPEAPTDPPPTRTPTGKKPTTIFTPFQPGLPIQDKMPVLGLLDGEAIPLLRPLPEYPTIAARDGIEGYVIVTFTITETGSVKDVSIVEANPTGYFEKSAIAAILKARYRPKVVDGKPVAMSGFRTRIAFRLEK